MAPSVAELATKTVDANVDEVTASLKKAALDKSSAASTELKKVVSCPVSIDDSTHLHSY